MIRAEDQMSGSRANAVKECNAEAQKMSQHTWADHQIHKYRSRQATERSEPPIWAWLTSDNGMLELDERDLTVVDLD